MVDNVKSVPWGRYHHISQNLVILSSSKESEEDVATSKLNPIQASDFPWLKEVARKRGGEEGILVRKIGSLKR